MAGGATPGLERAIFDEVAHARNVAHLRKTGLRLPRIADLADPPARQAETAAAIADADPDA